MDLQIHCDGLGGLSILLRVKQKGQNPRNADQDIA